MNLVSATALRREDADPVGTFAVQRAPRRDRAVLVVGSTVYVWPMPARPDALRVRRVRLDAPVRRVPDGPVFGGDDKPEAPATRRVQADRLRRLQARAALYATPATLCSTQDIADVFALRESDVRASRPASARRVGRAWMAPFGDWLVALGVDLDGLAAQAEAPRVVRTRAPAAPTLRPLGGPSAGRR
jgi:hypothetical protein